MNRRKFLKFLGMATLASGVAAIAGLPAKLIKDDPNVPIHFEDTPEYVAGDFTTGKSWVITRNGNRADCHQFSVRDGSIYPFKNVTLMLDGKSQLGFHNEAHNIKVGDHVTVYNMDKRQEWAGGWVSEVYANIVTLYNPRRNYLAMPQKV